MDWCRAQLRSDGRQGVVAQQVEELPAIARVQVDCG